MGPRRFSGLFLLMAVISAHPSQHPSAASEQPSAVSQQPSAVDQLSDLLGPAVEAAVSRAQSLWQLAQQAGRLQRLQDGDDVGQRALAELTRQQVRLDVISHDVTALQLKVLTGGGRGAEAGSVCRPSPSEVKSVIDPRPELETKPKSELKLGQESKLEPEPESTDLGQQPEQEPESEQISRQEQEGIQEPDCQETPAALPIGWATYQMPAVRACARSCQQLRDRHGVSQDGVYWLTGLSVPALCDFTHDGGGWMLLLTAVSRQGWDPLSVLGRSEMAPSFTDNYSILRYADSVRDLGTGDKFAYRIETQAEKGRQRWGGIWFAPRHYSFVDETGTQTEISLVRRFDDWKYKDDGIKRRMPFINTGGLRPYQMWPVLTTASATEWWGTMVTHHTYTVHNHSPWHKPEAYHSGTVLYWMRENVL